jgi:hypothetical protein
MELVFHTLTLEDKERILRYTAHSQLQNCDLSFANLYGWQFLYQTEVAEWGGFLLFRFHTDGHLAYLMPVGQGDIHAVMEALHEDACGQGRPFLMLGGNGPWLEAAVRHEKTQYTLTSNRDHADYIYLRETLATLPGKKLQPKRNHLNKFRKLYPDYTYRPLTPDLVPLCLRLSDEWGATKTAPDAQRSVASESRMIRRVLEQMNVLDITGGTLFAEGRLIAFTFGAPINDNTFDVCVEKADIRYEGAYTAINREFAARLPERFIYINREEDLGLEGLRKAKLSYQPHLLLEKFSVWSACTVKQHLEEQLPSCREVQEKWQTRALWKLCFNDSNDFLHLYFNKKYTPDANSVIVDKGRVVSALQRLPYRMVWNGTDVPVGYLSGVCTLPERRGHGLMRQLLGEAHRRMYADGQWFSLLIPAEEGLKSYYARSGYVTCAPSPSYASALATGCSAENLCHTVFRNRQKDDCAQLAGWITTCQTKLRPCFVCQTEQDIDVVLDDLFLSGGVWVKATDREGNIKGIVLATPENEKDIRILDVFVQENTAIAQALFREAARGLQRERGKAIYREAPVQIRILNAKRALALHASVHPELQLTFSLEDKDIAENNGTYILAKGECRHTGDRAAPSYTAEELVQLLFRDQWPYLSLMLN